MKLYSWNCNGIRAVERKGALRELIDQHDPDILCLQETKAERGQVEIDYPQYIEHFYSAVKKGYSGTAIFSKEPALQYIDGFPAEFIERYQVPGDTYGDPNMEGRVIAAEFEDFWVVTVYTPNAKRDLSRLDMRANHWDKAFLAYLQELEKTKPVLACGDFNAAHTEIDLARPKENARSAGFTVEERQGITNILSAGFIDTFRAEYPDTTEAYTWWTAWGGARDRNVGWRIDYWFASKSLMGRLSNPLIHPDIYGSDHCPVSVEIDADE